ncbi:MAG TPA: sigma-70 family RNA polymerase sigma factor [Terriglobia bacterium]|nr:sigma-70 family RNA polymerase sigma factor [Terriglobia bacterium]
MTSPEELYEQAVDTFGPALERLARGYEADTDKRSDLLQEIHVALWRSFSGFNGRCSLRTWVYRVAHNRAVSYVRWDRLRNSVPFVDIDDLKTQGHSEDREAAVDKTRAQERLLSLIQRLPPVDRQIVLLYLEGVDAVSIGEIVGLSATNVGSKVHRLKAMLIEGVRKGGKDVR